MIPTTEQQKEYTQLCEFASIEPTKYLSPLTDFVASDQLANKSLTERLTSGLQVLMELMTPDADRIERIDKTLIDHYIAKFDELLSKQLDAILHHPSFQELESLWRSLHYLVSHTDFRANTKIEFLDISKSDLHQDFSNALELSDSGLYQHIYAQEYDMPGGEPFSAMISPYTFSVEQQDIDLLKSISQVAAIAHCPFIGSVNPQFFKKENFNEVAKIFDLENYLDSAEYIRWNAFRNTEEAKYIGLTLPKFLLRLPYGEDNRVKNFLYQENVLSQTAEKYLWGSASFAFAVNLGKSFKYHGWCVNIRGSESGGKVSELVLHQYNLGFGTQTKIPTEVLISESRELELSNLGFIPLSYYKNSDYACFFSANSIQKPAIYDEHEATANSRINARLPYIFLSSRIAHYLKVIQRENIGASKDPAELENELNTWLQKLVTKMNNPSAELIAQHPLRAGEVSVEEIESNPGFYRVSLHATPHFQIEGVDVRLSLVAKMPRKKEK
ncbi:MAG: type VI secretion system contractile sheath large subunit [Proteobacteria bacterium]|nr:type VI secretion system contractile sheath large subunit [Pseudomonadota bacterium]